MHRRSLILRLSVLVCASACTGVLSDPVTDPERETVAAKYVFVSSTLHVGIALGGLEGADRICTQLAAAAKLRGDTYKAWLSIVGTSAADRLAHATSPYKLIDGTLVAASWADLTDGELAHAIDRDERGREILKTTNAAWTGTEFDGQFIPPQDIPAGMTGAHLDCAAWSIAGSAGVSGVSGSSTGLWSHGNPYTPCNGQARLYCFEQ